MLLNQRHEKDSYSAAKLEQSNVNPKDNSLQISGTADFDCANATDKNDSCEIELQGLQQQKTCSVLMKTLNGTNITTINNDLSTKGNILEKIIN